MPTLHETIMPNYDLLAWAEEANHRHRLLLRSCSLRPRHRRAAKEADELPASHGAAPSSRSNEGTCALVGDQGGLRTCLTVFGLVLLGLLSVLLLFVASGG